MARYEITVEEIREIAKAHGIIHAEFVLEQSESQLGRDALKHVRAELNRIMDEEEA